MTFSNHLLIVLFYKKLNRIFADPNGDKLNKALT